MIATRPKIDVASSLKKLCTTASQRYGFVKSAIEAAFDKSILTMRVIKIENFPEMSKYIRALVLGDEKVGKTSLIQTMTRD